MSLYPDARTNLATPQRDKLDRWEAAATVLPPEGPNVVSNVRAESHLIGDPPEADSLALQAFLERIITRFGTADVKQSFEEATGAHLLQGRHLQSSPTGLHRFRPLDRFGESVARANGHLSRWKLDSEEYVTNILENWNTIGREMVARAMLGSSPQVFVTFEKKDGSSVINRFRSGPEIMEALGMRLQAAQDVIGLRYAPPPDAPLKFPTSADGGWNRDFVAARANDPPGWTRPVPDPRADGWPEAVHQNRRADVVVEKPFRHPKI